jgi:hypothetical protein
MTGHLGQLKRTQTYAEGLERMLERALDQRDEREAENKRLLARIEELEGEVMDLVKLHQRYPGSTLVPHGAFSERELQMLARIERLEALINRAIGWNEATRQVCTAKDWDRFVELIEDMRKALVDDEVCPRCGDTEYSAYVPPDDVEDANPDGDPHL